MSSAARKLPEAPEAAKRQITAAHDMVSRSLAGARRFVWDLREPVASSQLALTLRSAAERLTSGKPTAVEVVTEGAPVRLPNLVQNEIFYIGQEAITNAVKHAAPARISIQLRYGEHEVVLSI